MERPFALVTGSRGFIGSWMVDYLVKEGYRVRATATSRSSGAYLNEKAELIQADLTNSKDLQVLFKDVDLVFHIAGIYDHSCPRALLYKVNVEGTRNLLEATRNFPGIKRIVVLSTGGFYDSQKYPNLVFTEEDPVNPNRNNYVASKYAQEQLSLEYGKKYNLPVTIIRPPSVYGPRSYYGFSLIIIRALRGQLYLIPQTGDRFCWATCHVLDVCRAAEFLAKVPEALYQVYNVCDDSRYLIKEIFYLVSEQVSRNKIYGSLPLFLLSLLANFSELIAKIMGERPIIEKSEIEYLYYPYLMSNQKIKNLGFELVYPDLKIGLKETIEWYQREMSDIRKKI